MYAYSYLLMNGSCIIIMLLVLRVHLRGLDKGQPARVFTMLVSSTLVYTVFDMLCGLIENDALFTNQLVSSLLNVGFFWTGSITAYLSFAYGEYEMDRPWILNKKTRLIGRIPLYATLVLTVLTLKYKFFYYIDEQGNYIKGPYYALVVVLSYGYIAVIGMVMLHLLGQKRYYVQRRKILALGSFAVCPLIAGLYQSTHTGISVICMGGTISLIQVFMDLQETRVTIDPLTHMNNRARLMQVLESSMADKKQAVYFLMMDLDNFKDVNDRYGHLEGDSALIEFGKTLTRVCRGFDGTLARYGGDEFAVIILPSEEDEADAAQRFILKLENELEKVNAASDKPYKLNVSIGCAKRSPELDGIEELISAADSAMYEEKLRRKGKSRTK